MARKNRNAGARPTAEPGRLHKLEQQHSTGELPPERLPMVRR